VSGDEDRRPDWLRWAQRVQAIAQTGLTYSEDPYDRERYEQLREIAVEMTAAGLDEDTDAVRPVLTSGRGYPTPKVDVRAVVFRGDELLLVRERRSRGWTFPGGWADVGDTPSAAAERETLEESGFRVRAEKALAILDKTRHEHPPSLDYTYKILIGCHLESGEPRTSHEIDDVGFFSEDAIRELELDPDRTTSGQIAIAFAHHRDPALPTELD
jgi:ADP-ribose pyrophosphatase YjhB (NUDIX family)